MKYSYLILIITSLLFGCTENVDLDSLDLANADNSILVVEGEITNLSQAHTVRLSRSRDISPDISPIPITGASLSISDGEQIFILQETQPGIYQTAPHVKGEVGKVYTLNIEVNGETYTASDSLIAVREAMEPIENLLDFGLTGISLSLFRNRFGRGENSKNQIFIDYPPELLLERINEYTYFYHELVELPPLFQLEITEVGSSLPSGTVLRRKKFSMSEEYYAFIRALLFETDWRGGFFDPPPANIPSNISNGGLGFFNASAVLMDTTKIQ